MPQIRILKESARPSESSDERRGNQCDPTRLPKSELRKNIAILLSFITLW